TPEGKQGTDHLLIQVGFIMLEIDCSSSPVIFTTCMNGCRIAEATKIFCQCFGSESRGIRAPACQTSAHVVLGLRADQALWQIIWLNQKEPVVVGSRKCLIGAHVHFVGRGDVK